MGNTVFEAKDIFISWNHHDRELKDKIVKAVEKGLSGDVEYKIKSTLWVWDSDRNCTGEVDSSCLNSIDLCSVFVVIITENSLKSEWVAKEINRALETRGNSFIVPVHLSGTIPFDEKNPFRRAVNSTGIDRADGSFDDDDASLLITKIVAAFNESCYWDYSESSFDDILTIDNEINGTEATSASIDNIYIERTLKKYNDPSEEELGESELVALTDPVLVIGEGGSGKSWLIRNMIRGIRKARTDSAPLVFTVPLKEMMDYEDSLEEYLFSLFVVPSRSFGYTLDNFKALLKTKNSEGSLFIFFDAVDEILRNDAIEQISEKLSAFFMRYVESRGNTFFTSRNADYGFMSKSLNIESGGIKAFSLMKFDAERRKAAVEKLFLQLRFEGDKDFFFASLESISEEITSNPFLLTQLAIIYKNEGNVPDALYEIYEKSVRYYLKRGSVSDKYPELSEILSLCAYDKFITESVYNKRFDFEKSIISKYDDEKDAKKALSYLRNRSIVINNNFTATLIFELLAAKRLFNLLVDEKTVLDDFGANTRVYSINDKTARKIAENAAVNSKWDNVLKIFLSKADNELDEAAITALYECFVGSHDNFMLFFETASSILKKRRDFELTVLSSILLRRTLSKDFRYYDELFFYIPKFRLYKHLAAAVLSVSDNQLTAFYLLRDICFIYDNKDKISEVDDIGINAELLAKRFAELKTASYRCKLCELFYYDDIIAPKELSDKYQPLYPREFCIIHAANRTAANADKALKKERDLEEAAIDSPKAFQDTDGIYTETDFNNPRFTGLCFLLYDTEKINSCVTPERAKMLSGVILLPSEHTEIEQMRFPKTNLLYYSVPYNTTKLCDYCFNFCREITYIFIPSFTKKISDKSFITVKRLWLYYEYSPRMTKITRFLPERTELYKLTAGSVKKIEKHAFESCTNLTLTSLPDEVTEIGGFAFEDCTSLALTSLPDRVTMINNSAFQGCTNLALTSLPYGVIHIGIDAFSGCVSLALTSLPNRVIIIEDNAFYGCTNLALTSLPYGVTYIGTGVFSGCTSLALTSLPLELSFIDESAFNNCSDKILKLVDAHNQHFMSCQKSKIVHRGDTVKESEYKEKFYITDIDFPDGLREIKTSAFEGCTNLALTSLPAGLTEIGRSAFKGCKSLALTSLPDGLTKIKRGAFSGCISLALTSLPEGLSDIDASAFAGCSDRIINLVYEHIAYIKKKNATIIIHCGCTVKDNEYLNKIHLTDIIFPDGLKEIGLYAFYGCTSLALTSLPDGVTKIYDNAFYGCTSLALTSLPDGLTDIVKYTFSGCTNLPLTSLPDGVTYIGDSAFSGCENLALTSLPDGVTTIRENAFRGCTSLALTSLPDGVAQIYWNSFEGCTSLALTSLPDGLTKIGASAFKGCTSLAITSLPYGVTTIRDNAFCNCTSLALTSLPDGVTEIGQRAFYGCTSLALTYLPNGMSKIGWCVFKDCTSLALTSLPDGVTYIGESAFEGCRNIALTSLPDSLTTIGDNAFSGCTGLTLTSLPNGLTEIGCEAFRGCKSLAITDLPRNLIVIGKSAFEACTGITEMSIPDSVQEIGDRAFFGCSLRRVRIKNEFRPEVQRIFGDAPIVFDFY